MCNVKMRHWEEAITCATAALKKDQNSAKALLYRARALVSSKHRQDGLRRAQADLVKAASIAPKDRSIKAELEVVNRRMEDAGASWSLLQGVPHKATGKESESGAVMSHRCPMRAHACPQV